MRFINLEQLRPKIDHFLTALAAIQAEVLAEPDPRSRSELIERNAAKWVALRQQFDAFSFGKCWYLECESSGADLDMDHFRPKGAVSEDASHPGYYWLAFEWYNLRLSCQRANRLRRNAETATTGGKGEHFPLAAGSIRARVPSDPWRDEIPALFDPTDAVDVARLSFQPDGTVCLAASYAGDPVSEEKLQASRTYLHLDWPKVRDGRKLLYNDIARIVDRGVLAAPASVAHAIGITPEFRSVITDLIELMHPRQHYSAAARAYIRSFRHHWWIESIVLKAAA
jgi:hypothetical protein